MLTGGHPNSPGRTEEVVGRGPRPPMNPRAGGRLPRVLIIAGHLVVDPTDRDEYVASCASIVAAARETDGCLDFSITADTSDAAGVRIYERWESEERLLRFRGSGPSDGQHAAILDADVKRYIVSSVEAP